MPIPIPPEVERINKLLIEHFGIDTSTGKPLWRVSWSDDQFEKRLMPTTNEGLELLHPEVKLVPKYRQWVPHMWVLERLTAVPETNLSELPSVKLSYEPLFPFESPITDHILVPTFEACKFIIDLVLQKQGKVAMPKQYNPDGNTMEEAIEIKRNKVDKLVEDIFGNETDVTDHLSRQSGVVISNTNNLIKEN